MASFLDNAENDLLEGVTLILLIVIVLLAVGLYLGLKGLDPSKLLKQLLEALMQLLRKLKDTLQNLDDPHLKGTFSPLSVPTGGESGDGSIPGPDVYSPGDIQVRTGTDVGDYESTPAEAMQ